MWKQDIGQWVERKGRRGWTGQQQPPQPQHSTSPTRHAVRVGFLPEGFKERSEGIPPAATTDFSSAVGGGRGMPNSLPEGTSHAGECWVAVYGVSAESILDVREYLDIMFGRTVGHACPRENGMVGKSHVLQVGSGTNWFYIKFENSVAAARAVYQSPLTIPILGCYSGSVKGAGDVTTSHGDSIGSNKANVKQEIVGVAWCNDAAFLQEHRQDNNKETEEGTRGNLVGSNSSDHNHNKKRKGGSPTKDMTDDIIKNAAGVMPCGADRLSRTRLPTSHSAEMGTTRGSRGLSSLLHDALHSPWSMRWTTRPSHSDNSPLPARAAETSALGSGGSSSPTDRREASHEGFHNLDHTASVRNVGVNSGTGSGENNQRNVDDSVAQDLNPPRSLFSQNRQEYFDVARHVNSAVPVPPLPGNLSILSAFRADVSQRRLPQRFIRTLINLPSYISHRLTSHTLHDSNLQGITTVDAQWNSVFGGCSIEQRYSQQRRMLRHRHYNALARLHTENGAAGESSPTLMYWAPLRWYEGTTAFSLVIFLLLLLLLSAISSVMVGTADVLSRDRWSSVATPSSPAPTEVEYDIRTTDTAEVPRVGQVQGTIFADGGYRSNLYQARTL